MCSSSEAGAYLRLIDLVYHPTLGLRVIKKKKKKQSWFWVEVSDLTGAESVVRNSLLPGPAQGIARMGR